MAKSERWVAAITGTITLVLLIAQLITQGHP
jgi:hypothetical protein